MATTLPHAPIASSDDLASEPSYIVDTLFWHCMLAMLVLGIMYSSTDYFEAALLISLFGCVSSTAMAKFLLRGEVIE